VAQQMDGLSWTARFLSYALGAVASGLTIVQILKNDPDTIAFIARLLGPFGRVLYDISPTVIGMALVIAVEALFVFLLWRLVLRMPRNARLIALGVLFPPYGFYLLYRHWTARRRAFDSDE
jgi:hypothetical protein